MDMTEAIIPKSDQLNADDLMAGPITVTVESVTRGSSEQPVDIHLAEYPDRVYRPSKSMSRVLVACWGAESATYTGRRMRLYRDPDITFGRDKVGGIRISNLSHIDEPQEIALTVTRGRRQPFKVEPLTDESPSAADWANKIAASDSIVELRQWWQIATAANRKLIEKRVKSIEAEALDGES